VTANGIYSIIKTRVREARITKNIHPHSLRHTYATLALLGGVPLQDVQVSMGHSSPNTTFRYFRAIEQVGRSPGRALGLNWQQPGTKEEPT
jgi:integrase/recombinase XerD